VLGPKTALWRSEPYRRYVSQQACFGCGIEGYSQCAHQNNGKGLSLRTSDWLTFPLCCTRPGHMGCHNMHDLCYDMTRDERRELEGKYVARMQEIAGKDGWSPTEPKRKVAEVTRKPLYKETT
jgi:hypothetical protein